MVAVAAVDTTAAAAADTTAVAATVDTAAVAVVAATVDTVAAAAMAVDTEAKVSMLSLLATVTYVIPFPSSLPSYLLGVVLM